MAEMLPASTDPIDHVPVFLVRFPANLDPEGLARRTEAFQRPRGARSG
ncbi:MAG TPA: hypothetical protein VND19_21140 [Acetobacteraceae bacterium]|nr:hypothetical protein [Acetobacteraceae bacterium]